MDIRDINMEPFEYTYSKNTGRVVQAIFKLQKDLLDLYIGVEKLPQYPIDINAPVNQVLIKDFIARVTEELGEAYESYLWLYNWARGDQAHDRDTAVQKLYNFNEEIADAIHFLVEALIFTGITPTLLNQYISQFNFPEYMPDDRDDTYNLVKDTPIAYQGRGFDKSIIALPHLLENLLTKGGQESSPNMKGILAERMWSVTYFLQLSRNALKNKPWKQSQMLSDGKVYRTNMVYAFIELVALCQYMGMTEKHFFAIYWAKNQVNHFRIQSKY